MPLANMFNPDTASFRELNAARDSGGPQSAAFTDLAPWEHQAFSREYVRNNPFLGPLTMNLVAPVYQAAKLPGIMPITQALGLVGKDATPASLDQLVHEYTGVRQGVEDNFNKLMGRPLQYAPTTDEFLEQMFKK